MLPDTNPARLARVALIIIALVAAVVLAFHSSGEKPPSLQSAQVDRQAAAARAAPVVALAAEARATTKPVVARAESLRALVGVERTGALRVQHVVVPVPPLVTERIQADSAAIGALSVALTLDSSAAAAQAQVIAADAKTITLLEHERSPRCGRRCGMVLGAVSVIALGMALR